jgi:hypothetical protein
MKNLNSKPIAFEDMPSAVAKLNDTVLIIKTQLDELKNSFEPKEPTEWLTRHEVAELLKCDISTVHNWTKRGKLTKYCIGDRTYYKRSDIEKSLIPIKF